MIFPLLPLGKIGLIIGRGITPAYATDGDVIVLNQRCVREGRVDLSVARRHDSNVRAPREEKYLRSGDLLVNSTGVGTLGRTARIPDIVERTVVDSHVTVVRANSAIDSRWLAYSMRMSEPLIEAMAEGSTGQTELSPSRLAQLEFPVPPLAEQRGIAATLGALDDKIESNRRAIDLAEALADQLFALSFNGTVLLTDVAKLTMGSSPPGDTYNEDGEGLPFYQGVRDFGRRFPGYRVWTTGAVRLAQSNDTLVSVRAPVGELNRSRETCCIGRGVAAVRSDFPSSIYYALRSADAIWEPFQHEGTVFGAINKSDLSNARLSWPRADAFGELEGHLSAIDEKIRSLSKEIEDLIALRDTLLPELLSGRIRVPEAREAVGAAV